MEELLYEFVDLIPDTYACPYMARIVGEDPVFRFHRAFCGTRREPSGFCGGSTFTFCPGRGCMNGVSCGLTSAPESFCAGSGSGLRFLTANSMPFHILRCCIPHGTLMPSWGRPDGAEEVPE